MYWIENMQLMNKQVGNRNAVLSGVWCRNKAWSRLLQDDQTISSLLLPAGTSSDATAANQSISKRLPHCSHPAISTMSYPNHTIDSNLQLLNQPIQPLLLSIRIYTNHMNRIRRPNIRRLDLHHRTRRIQTTVLTSNIRHTGWNLTKQ